MRLSIFAFILSLAALQGGLAAADLPDSPAQQALFDGDHLKNVTSPTRLGYDFSRSGDPAKAYEDKVEAHVRAVHENGGRDVWITFLTGERQMPSLPAMGFHGNPLLMYFLEHDVVEMRDDFSRPAAYFRNRIRHALFDSAEISQITIDFGGKAVPATDIHLAPFAQDKNVADLPGVTEKSYDFILSDAVPGGLYQIRTQMPMKEKAAQLVETMTFAGATQ
jgi:hypothetical protein